MLWLLRIIAISSSSITQLAVATEECTGKLRHRQDYINNYDPLASIIPVGDYANDPTGLEMTVNNQRGDELATIKVWYKHTTQHTSLGDFQNVKIIVSIDVPPAKGDKSSSVSV